MGSGSPSPSGDDPDPKRRRRGGTDGDDRLSALPDELLVTTLELLADARAVVSTAVLSRRWRRLDRAWLAEFDLSVAANLPPEYAGAVDSYRESRGGDAGRGALAQRVAGCEVSAMEAYVRGLAPFLASPERYPRARDLRLEFFVAPKGGDGGVMAPCLASALRWPSVENLAVHAVPRAAVAKKQRAHLFLGLLDGDVDGPPPALASCLTTLHVKNCVLTRRGRSYGAFPALSRLTLEVTPRIFLRLTSTYLNNIMRACQQLVSLHLVSCTLKDENHPEKLIVDLPPASMLRELILETCLCAAIKLINTPNLERLVLERCSPLSLVKVHKCPRLETLVCHGAVPRLAGSGVASLRFVELSVFDPIQGEEMLASFLRGIPNVEEQALCFRGGRIWVERKHFVNRFDCLTRLSIDLPAIWPLNWMVQLLEVAEFLEKLHIHIFAPSQTPKQAGTITCYQTADTYQHKFMKEIKMVGFEGTEEQIALIRLFMRSCRVLKTVYLIRHPALLEETLDQQGASGCPSWLMEDEMAEMVSKLTDGIHSSARITLG